MDKYIQKTKILDFESKAISDLIDQKGWRNLDQKNKIAKIYDYVQNDVQFGYNKSDGIKASDILADGLGQCNTKSTLFIALLRAVGVPCRFHGFAIHKRLQKGLINGLAYFIAPNEIIHSWVEVYFNEKWYSMEGLILDAGYLKGLKSKFRDVKGAFCGFGVDVKDFNNLQTKWNECDTFIQSEGIAKDYGIFDSPDDFYNKHGANLKGIKKIIYQGLVSKIMNNNVKEIRV